MSSSTNRVHKALVGETNLYHNMQKDAAQHRGQLHAVHYTDFHIYDDVHEKPMITAFMKDSSIPGPHITVSPVTAMNTSTKSPNFHLCECCGSPARYFKPCYLCKHWSGVHGKAGGQDMVNQCFTMVTDERRKNHEVCVCCVGKASQR